MRRRLLLFGALALGVLAVAIGGLYFVGAGGLGRYWEEGEPTATPLSEERIAARTARRARAGGSTPKPKQVLFGDLHVHTTFSPDAFVMALPVAGGDGARPISDACDFARYCSALDFWSINDHATGLTPWKWEQTVEAIRRCDEISGAQAGRAPDVVPFLGWEWTQIGTTPDNHYGHKNVVMREIERVPDRPVAALNPFAPFGARPNRWRMGMFGLLRRDRSTQDFIAFTDDFGRYPDCPEGADIATRPAKCRDAVATPTELFRRLDEWGLDSVVIPHGTTWGLYTPAGSSWDKQIQGALHDPARQTLIEVYSGHGNSEEFRAFRQVEFGPDGARRCPAPNENHTPACWRAGEILETRCLRAGAAEGATPELAARCGALAAQARQHIADGNVDAFLALPGADASADDWLDADQCRDCFQPSFNYRPRSSVQYIMALRDFETPGAPRRFDFGFMAASDNHSARPGTGYKEYERLEMTDARIGTALNALIGGAGAQEPGSPAVRRAQFQREFLERSSSFFTTGGLVALHAEGRGREEIWDALERREVYGTSGPRILLWFDLLGAPAASSEPWDAGARGKARVAMGGATRMRETPRFQVRAVGAREQLPGCPQDVHAALRPEQLARLCAGECHHPGDRRHVISRIEVVRIRPQQYENEPVEKLVEDPWRSFACAPNPEGCNVQFSDPDFAASGRDALYYVRAIQEPLPAVAVDPLGLRGADGAARAAACSAEDGGCALPNACKNRGADDDCLAPDEARAWSSPIFVAHPAASDG